MWGFKQSYRHELANARSDCVLLLGAGGAGAAVGYALLDSGVTQLLISDVDGARARALAERLASRFGAERVEAVSDCAAAASRADGIVNATPVGMAKLPGLPLDPSLLRASCWVADIIYFPIETQLLAEARKRGCHTMGGEGMAIHQAARAFELFTGKTPDISRVIEAIPHGKETRVWGDSACQGQREAIRKAAPRAQDFTHHRGSRASALSLKR